MLAQGKVYEACVKLKERNILPAVTGRFSQEPYEGTQVFSKEGSLISVRALERFIADYSKDKQAPEKYPESRGVDVAVIGSGPAGLFAAAKLKRLGYGVTVYECLDKIGGVLAYGIPEFRLPKEILNSEINYMKSLGIKFKTNVLIGQTLSIDDLFKKGNKAVFLTLGAGLCSTIDITASDAPGVVYADSLLKKVNLMNAHQYPRYHTKLNVGKKVLVVGGGNAAVDCARVLRRLDREVSIVIRSTIDDMNIKSLVCDHAKAEGIKIETLLNPKEILKNDQGFVAGVRFRRFDYVDEKGDDVWTLKEIEDSDVVIDADTVVVAVGHKPDTRMLKLDPDVRVNKNGAVWTKRNTSMTSKPGVFIAGALPDGAGSIMWSMLSSKKVAKQIHEYLS